MNKRSNGYALVKQACILDLHLAVDKEDRSAIASDLGRWESGIRWVKHR